MTQVSEDVYFGPHHNRVVAIVNAASGLEPEELVALARQYDLLFTPATCEALNRVRTAANRQSAWSLVKKTLQNIAQIYISGVDRCPTSIDRMTLDTAIGAVYHAALALMAQDIISPSDYSLLTKPCRTAGIASMLQHLSMQETLLPA